MVTNLYMKSDQLAGHSYKNINKKILEEIDEVLFHFDNFDQDNVHEFVGELHDVCQIITTHHYKSGYDALYRKKRIISTDLFIFKEIFREYSELIRITIDNNIVNNMRPIFFEFLDFLYFFSQEIIKKLCEIYKIDHQHSFQKHMCKIESYLAIEKY